MGNNCCFQQEEEEEEEIKDETRLQKIQEKNIHEFEKVYDNILTRLFRQRGTMMLGKFMAKKDVFNEALHFIKQIKYRCFISLKNIQYEEDHNDEDNDDDDNYIKEIIIIVDIITSSIKYELQFTENQLRIDQVDYD